MAMLSCLLGLCGCQSMEAIDYRKCTIPPNHPHEVGVPFNYGYFPTLWRPWPGAEAVPGQTMQGGEPKSRTEQKDSTTETLPDPNESTTPEGDTGPEQGLEPGLEGIFDPPTEIKPEDPADAMPPGNAPEEAMPDELTPPKSEEPAMEEETLPDNLLPEDDARPEPPQGRSAWNLESLPTDAPEGNLVSEGQEPTVVRKSAPPGLLQPAKSSPRARPAIENARRSAPTRSAAKPRVSRTPITLAKNDTKMADLLSPVAKEEGPRLIGQGIPEETPLPLSDRNKKEVAQAEIEPVPHQLSEVSLQHRERDKLAVLPTDIATSELSATVPDKPAKTWQANPSRSLSSRGANAASISAANNGWQRSHSRTKYAAVQASHAEPEVDTKAAPARHSLETKTNREENPLR